MEEILLNAELREELGRGKVKDLKDKGFIPAVIYSEGKNAQALKVSKGELIRLIHHHRIEGVVISLKVKEDDKEKARSCLIKEIQYDPVHDDILHVDFNEISLTKEIKVNIPIEAVGEPIGVKQEGGSLEHILWEVEVECLPTNIPKNIQIDVSQLKMGEAIHVKDIPFPAGVKVLNDLGAIILQVAAPMKEEVPVEAVEGEEAKEPEVIKEKKEVPGEGEAEPEEGKEKK
ncbi:MAG: 50S ribosomal protein L25 [Candidatus Omnitrophica bacterium]|nr:50S ribosomal protein L25 [Candidatus Omnitrophota bacterium]MBU1868936.1 50S ribosomal protein L25 [Candidatus Omnitrophota bacterium]